MIRLTRFARLALESLEQRTVLSISPIGPSAGYPFTAIVELRATFPDGQSFVGSGAMIDRFHVLTAGHVLYSSADGGFASRITATADLYGTSTPFGTASMTYERTYNAFVNYNKTHPHSTAPGDYDIGLITLNRTLGDSTSWFSYGYDNNNGHFSSGHVMNTAGYPAAGGYDGTHMQFSSGSIAGLSSDGTAIQYNQSNITTYGGQSGSPVWDYNSSTGSRVIYGVHVGGNGTSTSLNFATRITQSIFNDLGSWRQADTPPSSPRVNHLQHAAFGPSTASIRTRAGVRAQEGDGGGEGGEGMAAVTAPTGELASGSVEGLALDEHRTGTPAPASTETRHDLTPVARLAQDGPAPGRDFRAEGLTFSWETGTHRKQDAGDTLLAAKAEADRA